MGNENNAAATLNTSGYNWGEALKVDVGDLRVVNGGKSGTGGSGTPLRAGRFDATLQEIKPMTYKTGAYGVKATYVIEGTEPAAKGLKNKKITENIILTKADGSKTPYGSNTLKRRLMSYGMPIEKILAFKGPRLLPNGQVNEHDLGDFKLVLSAPVTIIVKEDGEYDGRPSFKVAAVYPREVTE